MSRKSIIILIVCTVILILVSITTVYSEPEIENLFISIDKDLNHKHLAELEDNQIFYNTSSDIYLILMVKNLSIEDEIKVIFKKTDNNYQKIIQENIITPQKNGSGKITISLINKNNELTAGDYSVEVFLNKNKIDTKNFNIKES